MVNYILLRAMSPLAHGDTVTGINNDTNVRLFMRQNVMINSIPARVPHFSENSIRSVFFRKTLADHLLSGRDEGDEFSKSLISFMYSGGNIRKGAKSPGDEYALAKEIYKNFPSIDLLGGALDDFILPRSRLRIVCYVVASEYTNVLKRIAPQEVVEESKNVSAFDLISEETRTRSSGGIDSDDNKMIYTCEVMAQGAGIYLQVHVEDHASDLCKSAVATACNNFDGFIGGQGRQGRGLVGIESTSIDLSDKRYDDYVTDNSHQLIEWLKDGTFGTKKRLCRE